MQLTVLDLFSGIGGFSLGLERTGYFRTVAFCEIDAKARRVLRKHWPDVDQFDDVRSLSRDGLELVGAEPIDIICGGFPCQDISEAGKRVGLSGERSGLWFEYHRLIEEFRPQVAIIENVSALRRRGLDEVLGSLAEIGYDAEWHCVGADALGATQHRERIWILAYPHNPRLQGPVWTRESRTPWKEWEAPHSEPLRSACGYWPPGPRKVDDIPRMADGPAHRVDRLKQLGNAVVPQIPQLIGEAVAYYFGLDLAG